MFLLAVACLENIICMMYAYFILLCTVTVYLVPVISADDSQTSLKTIMHLNVSSYPLVFPILLFRC